MALYAGFGWLVVGVRLLVTDLDSVADAAAGDQVYLEGTARSAGTNPGSSTASIDRLLTGSNNCDEDDDPDGVVAVAVST